MKVTHKRITNTVSTVLILFILSCIQIKAAVLGGLASSITLQPFSASESYLVLSDTDTTVSDFVLQRVEAATTSTWTVLDVVPALFLLTSVLAATILVRYALRVRSLWVLIMTATLVSILGVVGFLILRSVLSIL